jgi:malonate-semialdehyde dehydrogenase (acetylating)/methylmalonate-semialdehyde dehydrogenase
MQKSSRVSTKQTTKMSSKMTKKSSKKITSKVSTQKRKMTTKTVPRIANWINGQEVQSETNTWIPIISPATGEVIAEVPQTTPAEHKLAVDAAVAAQKQWALIPATVRQRHINKFINLINEHELDIAESIVRETCKTLADAKGDVFRGVEVMESMSSLAHLKGETMLGVARDVDTVTFRQPLGVVGGIFPFNFGAMLPLWMIGPAAVTGNAIILKPSEKNPTPSLKLAKLAKQAGFPDGIINIVNGAHDTVNFICDDPHIKSVSFVGSNSAGEYIANRATQNGKRVQSNMAAKNHGVFMPDCDKEASLNALASAAFGAAAQRCMALTCAVFVGETREWVPELVSRAQKLRCGPVDDPSSDYGPLITCQSVQRINDIIDQSTPIDGVDVVLDGRNPTHISDKYKKGNWMNPTIITMDMKKIGTIENLHKVPAYKQELFGPGLVVIEADSLEQAIEIVNANEYGNGASIFTNSGAVARKFTVEAEPTQIGHNVPIPLAPAMFSFSSNKASFRGAKSFYGREGIHFYTQEKTVTSQWKLTPEATQISMSFPTVKH